MQPPELEFACPECSKALVDAGDELVCPLCGAVQEKEVLGPPGEGLGEARGPGQRLGSYMGPRGVAGGEAFARGVSGSNSRYGYLKVVSDYAGRKEGSAEECFKTMERVVEKLHLPRVVLMEATSIARKVLKGRRPRRRVTVGAVSAYSLVAACKVAGVASVSSREIAAAHAALGRHVSTSSIIQLMIESPVRTYARRPEDYVGRVVARLSTDAGVARALAEAGVRVGAYFSSVRETANEVLGLVDEGGRAGRRPCALAASAVYSAESVLSRCDYRKKRITQRQVAEWGDAAEYTIREQCATVFAPAVSALVARRSRTLPPASAL